MKCSVCHGTGEIEVCIDCGESIENCSCESPSASHVYEVEECNACDGSGEEPKEEE